MKKYKTLIAIFSLLILVNCSEDLIPPTEIRKYPTELNSTWTYSSKMYEQYYDSLGNLSDTILIFSDSTLTKIVKLNDTVGNYYNLFQFISYDLSSPQYIEQMWYLNNDNGFYAIAYSNAGSSQPILPKAGLIKGNKLLQLLTKSISLPGIFIDNDKGLMVDSILFYESPRYVLKYPVFVGSKWTELSVPFHRDRVIKKEMKINVPSGMYNCYLVEMKSNDAIFSKVIFNDYISLNTGLILRQIEFDSLAFTNETGDTLGFYKSWLTCALLNKQ